MPSTMPYSVDGLAEVVVVVARDALVVVGVDVLRALGRHDLAGRGGEADVDGVAVAGEHGAPLAPRRAVALVDDDVAEVVLAVVAVEVRRVPVSLDAERLVGGDDDSRVPRRVARRRGVGVGAEHVVQRAERLPPQLVAVADEERAAQLARVGEGLEDADRDARLARAGRERQQRAPLPARDALQHRAFGGLLVVALALARPVPQRGRLVARGVDAARLAVAREQVVRRRELAERQAARRLAAVEAELDEQRAVGRVRERDVVSTSVPLRLLHALERRAALGLRLDERDGERRALVADGGVQHIVRPPARAGRAVAPHHGLAGA